MEQPVFVDWLSMYQVHPGGGLPVINKGCVFSLDEDGGVEWTSQRHITVEGSFDSRLRLRCDGSKVEASGNIGRFRRPDNLFGFSYEECVRRWNRILNEFCLPPFTKGQMCFYSGDTTVSFTGAINTRIDLTKNYAVFGREDLVSFMGWLATHQRGRLKVGVSADGGTIEWGRGSQYCYEKFYDKYLEMQHQLKRKKYLPPDVIEFVRDVGVGRHELSLKSRFLTQNGYRFLGGTSMGDLINLYRHRSQLVLTDKIPFDDFNDIPMPYRATAKDWRDGLDLAAEFHVRKYQRHRRALLAYGIDIATRCNVAHLRTRIKTIEVTALVAPEWYRQNYG